MLRVRGWNAGPEVTRYYRYEVDWQRLQTMSDANPSRLRKRPLEVGQATSAGAAGEIDIASCATIAYSSENPAHPVEHLVDGRSGPGATRWLGARPDVTEQIVIEFDQPQTIDRKSTRLNSSHRT